MLGKTPPKSMDWSTESVHSFVEATLPLMFLCLKLHKICNVFKGLATAVTFAVQQAGLVD